MSEFKLFSFGLVADVQYADMVGALHFAKLQTLVTALELLCLSMRLLLQDAKEGFSPGRRAYRG